MRKNNFCSAILLLSLFSANAMNSGLPTEHQTEPILYRLPEMQYINYMYIPQTYNQTIGVTPTIIYQQPAEITDEPVTTELPIVNPFEILEDQEEEIENLNTLIRNLQQELEITRTELEREKAKKTQELAQRDDSLKQLHQDIETMKSSLTAEKELALQERDTEISGLRTKYEMATRLNQILTIQNQKLTEHNRILQSKDNIDNILKLFCQTHTPAYVFYLIGQAIATQYKKPIIGDFYYAGVFYTNNKKPSDLIQLNFLSPEIYGNSIIHAKDITKKEFSERINTSTDQHTG